MSSKMSSFTVLLIYNSSTITCTHVSKKRDIHVYTSVYNFLYIKIFSTTIILKSFIIALYFTPVLTSGPLSLRNFGCGKIIVHFLKLC